MLNESAVFPLGINKIAVAVSGGGDSMALLHYLRSLSASNGSTVIALNVEHGIRGEASVSDSLFVRRYCAENSIPLLEYSVNSPKKAKEEKLSVEQAARILRYECFFNAVNEGKCDAVATAHHLSDVFESTLFNFFRGTGLKGLVGIKQNYENKIIRPFLSVSKEEINQYLKENDIPYVTDATNFCEDYTRNYIRLNIAPEIKKIFPEAETAVKRLSEIAEIEDDYMDGEAKKALYFAPDHAEIKLPLHKAVFSRAVIIALKHFGLQKDWEKQHADDVFALSTKETGKSINLPKGVRAIREYDKIVFLGNDDGIKESFNSNRDIKEGKLKIDKAYTELPFSAGEFDFCGKKIKIELITAENYFDIKDGFYADATKIPKNAVIRFKKPDDVFTKFGGGTKSLTDYLTDKKISARERKSIPIIAVDNDVLVIFGTAISEKVKADGDTDRFYKFI